MFVTCESVTQVETGWNVPAPAPVGKTLVSVVAMPASSKVVPDPFAVRTTRLFSGDQPDGTTPMAPSVDATVVLATPGSALVMPEMAMAAANAVETEKTGPLGNCALMVFSSWQ